MGTVLFLLIILFLIYMNNTGKLGKLKAIMEAPQIQSGSPGGVSSSLTIAPIKPGVFQLPELNPGKLDSLRRKYGLIP